jgi:predicted dehydrogenase
MSNSTSKPTVNIAVVGLGFMGVTHLRAYLQVPGAKIFAVCDAIKQPVNGVLQGVAGNIKTSDDINLGPDVRVFKKIEEVLAEKEVDLVDICTPTPLHHEQAIASLKAGKHVFCEKPLARTSAQARDIIEAERASGKFLMPAMCMRFWPGWAWLKDVVSKQQFGRVAAARFRRVTAMPAWSKQGTYSSDLGGALFDLHIHDTDFVQFLFGRPKSVFSTGVAGQGGAIDHVVTSYNYPGGPSVYAEGNWLLAKGFNMAYTIYCDRATIDFDLARGAEALQVTEHGQEARTVPLEGDGYNGEVRYIVECLQNNRRPEIVTAPDGLSALEICEAEEKSIRTGQVVQL